MTHRNAPLSVEGRERLVRRCQNRPIAHVAAEMGGSRGVCVEVGEPTPPVRRPTQANIYAQIYVRHGEALVEAFLDQAANDSSKTVIDLPDVSGSEALTAYLAAATFDIPSISYYDYEQLSSAVEMESVGEQASIDPEVLTGELAERVGLDLGATVKVGRALGLVATRAAEAEAARQALDEAVVAARLQGATWAAIGKAAGMTHPSANQKWRLMAQSASDDAGRAKP